MFLEKLLAQFGRDFVDVIKAVPDRNGTGTLALSAEIVGYQPIRQPGMDLVAFAKRHFGTGRLRKIGRDLYVVLRAAPVPRPPVFPTWCYHV